MDLTKVLKNDHEVNIRNLSIYYKTFFKYNKII
jgi:hypothetical protein